MCVLNVGPWFFLVVILAFLKTSPAFAQLPLFVGEREAYTANTGVAREGSTSAALYNPAGLATIENNKLSASATLFERFTQKVSGEFNAQFGSFHSVPTQVATVWKFSRWRVAFSVFNTQAFDIGLSIRQTTAAYGEVPSRAKIVGSTLLIGPSLATVIDEHWRAGVSLMVRKRDTYGNSVYNFDTTQAGQAVKVLFQNEVTRNSLLGILQPGAIYDLGEGRRVGLRVDMPSIRFSGTEEIFQQAVGYSDNAGTYTNMSVPGQTSKGKWKDRAPLGLAAGWSMPVPVSAFDSSRLFTDLTYSTRTRYQPSGNLPSESVELLGSVTLSTGMEFVRGARTFSVGGMFAQNPERNDRTAIREAIGITAGVIESTSTVDTGFGGYYAFGSSQSGATTAKASAFGVMLNSGYKF